MRLSLVAESIKERELLKVNLLLGMIKDKGDDFRSEVCRNNQRTAQALQPLIEKQVAPGGTIRIDQWCTYLGLARLDTSTKL